LIAAGSTNYHHDGEAVIYNPDAEEPIVTYRGYADPEADSQLDWTGRLTNSSLTEE